MYFHYLRFILFINYFSLNLRRASVDRAHKILRVMEYVYILKCADNTYYTGHTANLDERIKRHNKGENTYTSPRRPFILVTFIAFSDKYKAISFEKYLKSGSGKAFAQKRLI